MPVLMDQKKEITITCRICGKCEIIAVTKLELDQARKNHTLFTKAVSHAKDGHVLTFYIDGEGIVRRKYCFDLVQKNFVKLEASNPKNLKSLFTKMLENSLE
ncbi:MAG: hypothetical protein KAT16_07495 [Candidatus Heimdallarchaeota archaeon]|nr:hypothetical protein [Candidatus Heimdallarchaeota archaeon]